MAPTATFASCDEGSLFLALRWHELFDNYTPDTFQPKLLTIPCLVKEAHDISLHAKQNERWEKHLRNIQDELACRLKSGAELTLLASKDLSLLSELSGSNNVDDICGMSNLLLLQGFPGQFEYTVRTELADLVDAGQVSAKKEKADALLGLLGSEAFRKGCDYSDYTDYETVAGRSPSEVLGWITNQIPDVVKDYDCIIAVRYKSEEEQSNIRSVLSHQGMKAASRKIPGLPDADDLLYFIKSVRSHKASDALRKLKADVQESLNLLGFYKQSKTPRLFKHGWIYTSDSAIKVELSPKRFDNFHPRRNAPELAGRAARALCDRKEEAALKSALDLHSQALRAKEDSIRLVNLWSATECLASLVDGPSVMDRVERLICPIVTWRRIDKTLRYVSISLHFWLQQNASIDRNEAPFPLGHNDTIEPERVLTILSQQEDSSELRQLFTLANGHPLLMYRLFRAWKYIHDHSDMHKRQASSQAALKWHLHRIYRARNLLVHYGSESQFVPQLANHLQHYLSQTLSRILHGLSFGTNWTSLDSVNYWRAKSSYVQSSLQKEPKSLVVSDFFPEHVKEPSYPVWS